MSNPYATTSQVESTADSFGWARRRRGGFLFRWIDVEQPIELSIVYSGWWFVQRLRINDKLIWWKISWLRIERKITVDLPTEIDAENRVVEIDITFGPALWIKRFQVWLDGETLYDGR